MTEKNTPSDPSYLPVLYVHARHGQQATKTQIRVLETLGLPLCSRVSMDGVQQTVYGYDNPRLLLEELARGFPGRPVIFLHAGFEPSKSQIIELIRLSEQSIEPVVLTMLSNFAADVNPFAGLSAPAQATGLNPETLVSLLAPGQLHTLSKWTDHFALVSTKAIECLTSDDAANDLMQGLQAAKGKLKVADYLFLQDPQRRLFQSLTLHPYESRTPPVFSELSSRLQRWLNNRTIDQPSIEATGKPATLHITHSWGGGVAQWIESYIKTDTSHPHFQLRSEHGQSGQGFGQKLVLYIGNELACPITSWWLQPPILSVDESNTGYQEILSAICARYNIGCIFVSSLVGHCLDALRSPIPTLQILHDHFPAWPLLSVNPVPYLADGKPVNLEQALQRHRKNQEFPEKDALAWSEVSQAYLQALREFDVKLAAPGQSVLNLQNRLLPGFDQLDTEIIPHGFPGIDDTRAVTPKPRKDRRLRLLILGRMQTGKGQELLLKAMPKIAEHAQVYLLGSGKWGQAFFGVPGVDVILEYKREELSATVTEIGPDLAALLSVVPETFSYTLSELKHLRIPTIATRTGSFPDRIEDGKNGWLIDPQPQALADQVATLYASPEKIEAIRKRLAVPESDTLEIMVKAYNALCPPHSRSKPFTPTEPDIGATQIATSKFEQMLCNNELDKAAVQHRELNEVIRQRTEWAQSNENQLKLEHQRRIQWADKATELNHKTTELNHKVELLDLELELKNQDYQHISEQYALILDSTSWKITRPLRVFRRVLKNFMLARAWNPLRWPWLFSQVIRNISTLGWKGSVERLQYADTEAVPQTDPTRDMESIGNPEAPTVFPEVEHPDASIVLPAYNKWVYTAACLRSLMENAGKYSFEVIVVDDQSSDETAERLANIKGINYLRNDSNLGFVGSCNRGASEARGEYLVMLNNDTQVLPGWLDELIDTFAREPQAGLVGARLVYPDGSLQESGGIIYRDGSGWNYGRNQQAEQPEYNFLREVDYCSGACIILKTKYFHDLGGFDTRYSPAYYEDTDLAFRVRESGLKVYVQPLSAVIHHEGVTSGTDTSSGIKKYQLSNQVKFVDRWKAELESQPESLVNPQDSSALRHASQHRIRQRILFIDAHTPEPDKDSGSCRLTNIMGICRSLGFGVTFFADNRDYKGPYTRELQRAGIEVLYHPWLESLHDFFRERGGEFDFVFISRHYVASNYLSKLKRYCPEAKFLFDTVDLHYLREQRLADLEQNSTLKRAAQQTRRSEMSVIKAADTTLVVSTVEKEVLREDAPGEKVHVLSNIHEVCVTDRGFQERQDIFFVGSFKHPPNIDAACWFVNDIWPLIHAQLPDIRFHLVGSNAPERVKSLNGEAVIFHGFVESLQPFLSGCRLAVAPLRYGAGVKGKVNMSMAHGQPVVATPAAVEGMFAEHEGELLVAEDAASFAREVVRLYQDEDLWKHLSKASVQNVEKHFSITSARTSLVELFDSFVE